ncbi:hypothetical protein CK230_29985 [Mesorhizobium sp. WSM3859]|nr:hypothetical protein CK230_29985 [Mesorhizobium sp. WSM3859]
MRHVRVIASGALPSLYEVRAVVVSRISLALVIEFPLVIPFPVIIADDFDPASKPGFKIRIESVDGEPDHAEQIESAIENVDRLVARVLRIKKGVSLLRPFPGLDHREHQRIDLIFFEIAEFPTMELTQVSPFCGLICRRTGGEAANIPKGGILAVVAFVP